MSDPISLGELRGIPVERLKGVGEKRRDGLAAVGVHNLLDLLTTYPRRWVDRTREARIEDLQPGESALVVVTLRSVSSRRARNRRTIVEAVVGDGSGRMHVVFFNQPWRQRQFEDLIERGRRDGPDGAGAVSVALFGKAELYRGALQMTNPLVDLLGDRTGRIVPIYPQSEKAQFSSWEFGGWVSEALRRCAPRGLLDPVPAAVLERHDFAGRAEAFAGIHLPETMTAKEHARRRLAFDELLRVQLTLVRRKRRLERDEEGFVHPPGGRLVSDFHRQLPYELTTAQRRVIDEIGRDLAEPRPMHRLLQGDVGAGKTVVALTALLAGVDAGSQGALMAPTEVLAEQHAASVRALVADLRVVREETGGGAGSLLDSVPTQLRVELLTNRVTGAARKRLLAELAAGEIDIAIGTHALIQHGVEFRRLGVVVVDEQHRFGVEQRAALRDKAGERVPDLLVMTATPIPRTAAMTVYGDLDVSVLDELPPGRTPIKTYSAAGPLDHDLAWNAVRSAVAEGRQAYVVCPLIDESEKLEVASAQETYDRLSAGELRGLRLGLLHGRMPSADKDETMERFRRGEIDVLVATTVIEVGVDVPNATVMVILDADRFGIAQLHQLRGRVGRGDAASECWLLTGVDDNVEGGHGPDPVSERVQALVRSTDGFELAEIDLQLRGEGTIMNTAQKGRSDLRLASLRHDGALIRLARQVAEELVGDDPELTAHPDLAAELEVLLSETDEQFLARS